jgi:hypothetical protein
LARKGCSKALPLLIDKVPVVLMEPPGLRLPNCGRAITLAAARRKTTSLLTLAAILNAGRTSLYSLVTETAVPPASAW